MSHPELFGQTFEKARVQGAQRPCRGCRGVPEKLFFPLLRAACGGAQEREEAGDTPVTPAKGLLPFAIPLGRLIQQ